MNLSKGQTINLSKNGNNPIFKIGASWGQIKVVGPPRKKVLGIFGGGKPEISYRSVDLDLCTFGINLNSGVVSECSYRRLESASSKSYMQTSGDDQIGGVKNGDNEIITVYTAKIPDNVTDILIVINSFSGQEFNDIPFAKVRVYEGEDNCPEVMHCEYNVSNDDSFKGARTLVIGRLFRVSNGWSFEAVGKTRQYNRIDQFINEVNNG